MSNNALVWITKRKGKKGTRYLVRWMEPGTGKNKGKTFEKLDHARDHATKLRKEIRDREYRPAVQISYDDWVKQHLESLTNSVDTELAPKTIAGHAEGLLALAETCKPKSPSDVSPKLIKEFRRRQLEKGLNPRTINKRISAIRSALSYAVRDEILPSNKLLGPLRLFLREERKSPRILTVEEVKALIASLDSLPYVDALGYKVVISLAYYHGLRRKEICYLDWGDVDYDKQLLCVVDRPTAHTKTRTSRLIYLRAETAALLKQWVDYSANEYVFCDPARFYWKFDKWFTKLVKKAGITHCTFHDLRKTCNTMMKNAGISAETAMQILGHTTFSTNERHYTGMLTKQQETAINAIPSVG